MSFRFTKLGMVNALWSLIPIFPAWTIFPAVILAELIKGQLFSCENSYRIIFIVAIVLTITAVVYYLSNVDYHLIREKTIVKKHFRLVNLALYALVNSIALITIVGVDLACNGDGQTLLAIIYSGPLASFSLVIFGLMVDIKVKSINHD